ncbi:MAG TPA: 4Fe-4S dicluster domain-containing protein [Polyangia bacterium]|jgi:formate dehydrogenase iron-sulfur subunit
MKAILTDVSKCIGCEQCVAACAAEHRLPAVIPARWTEGDGLSAQRFTAVVRKGGSYVRKQCRHCVAPACVSACPVGALRKTADGPVVYDAGKCLGCRYCMMACPYGIPRYDWASAAPTVRKCTMCAATRLEAGRPPACTEACPTKATIFGERDALLAEAHRRIREAPGKYQPRVCGETDVGGTCVLYVAPIPLEFLSLGQCQEGRVLPTLTATAMAAVPPVFVTVGALMGGLYWIIDRRRKLAGAPAPLPPAPDGGDKEKGR